MAIQGNIGLVGGGNMGSALLKGMLEAVLVQPGQVTVAELDIDRAQVLKRELGVKVVSGPGGLPAVDLLILAVKPAQVSAAAHKAKKALGGHSLVISLAAGVKRATVAEALPSGQPLVRAMPNTPALIRRGITAICGDAKLDPKYMEMARQVFSAVGHVTVVEEKLMNAVTAVSGSGPAYVFVIIEALADAGVNQGLDRATAMSLAAHTVAGAAELLIAGGLHPGNLKDQVASPGGTTMAGLYELEKAGLRGILMRAVEAATERGHKLGG